MCDYLCKNLYKHSENEIILIEVCLQVNAGKHTKV